jgi:hypothetical protein
MIGLRPETPIFRVFTIDRLFNAIVREELALVRPRMWEDPYENLLYQTPLRNPDGSPLSIESLGNRLYGQCWTLASVSDALWRIYSPYKIGIRVRTTVETLFGTIWRDEDENAATRYFIGKVDYLSPAEFLNRFKDPCSLLFDTSARAPVVALLSKRKAFSHEREVRLILQDSTNREDQIVYVKIKPNEVFKTLQFDPRMDSNTVETFVSVLRSIGFRNRISQSNLYNAPTLRSHVVD